MVFRQGYHLDFENVHSSPKLCTDLFFIQQELLQKPPSVCGNGHISSHRPQHAHVRPQASTMNGSLKHSRKYNKRTKKWHAEPVKVPRQ